MELLAYAVLLLTYLGLGLGYWPGYRMNRAAIALTGAAFLIVLGVLDFEEAWQALEPNTLGFLFGVMVLNAHLAYAGFFQLVLSGLVRLARSPLGLLVWLTFGSGILSALFLNDTIAILFTPLVLALTRSLGLPPVPYLLALAGATNLGSVATLTGNPQNIVVGSLSKITYLDFAVALTPVALLGLLVQVGLLYALYPAVRSRAPCPPCLRFVFASTGRCCSRASGLPWPCWRLLCWATPWPRPPWWPPGCCFLAAGFAPSASLCG